MAGLYDDGLFVDDNRQRPSLSLKSEPIVAYVRDRSEKWPKSALINAEPSPSLPYAKSRTAGSESTLFIRNDRYRSR